MRHCRSTPSVPFSLVNPSICFLFLAFKLKQGRDQLSSSAISFQEEKQGYAEGTKIKEET
jgi:hypothetical protein